MSTLSLPAILTPTTRTPNSLHSVRRTRSLSDLSSEAPPSLTFERKCREATPTPDSQHPRPRFPPSSATGSARYVTIDVPQNQTTSHSETEPNNESKGTLYVKPSAEQKKKEEESHLVNLLQQYTSVKSSGSRNYNYEDKYPEDQPGEELGPNARFFNVYLDEAEKYDDDMIRGLSGTLDALLVFAALFSAVVTTFVVDTSHALQPDQALITSSLLYEQVQYLRANGNSTIIATVHPSQYTPDSLTHSTSDVWVNGLFFASLSLSLATALLSVLAKQWLQAYTSLTSGSARDNALVRHHRFMGFEEWKVPQIIGFLPLILHASLAVFIAGLIVFIRGLYPRISWIVVGIAGPAFFIYLVSIILPAIYIRCPYRITVLYTPIKTVILLLELTFNWLRSWHWKLHYDNWWRSVVRYIVKASHNVSIAFSSAILSISLKVFSPASTLKHSELQLVQDRLSCQPVLCDGILWLHNMSSNHSVRQVAACSFAGVDFSYLFPSEVKKVQLSKLHLTAVSADKELWDPSKTSSSSHRAATKLAGLFQHHDVYTDDLTNDWFSAAYGGRTNEVAFLHHVWKVPVDSTTIHGRTAFLGAALNNHYATTKLLIELGANPDSVFPDGSTALMSLCQYGMATAAREIGKLLLEAGADINLGGPGEGSSTPLYIASGFRGDCDLIKWLIENGADVNKIGGRLGTALHSASSSDHVGVVKLLLERGATINLKNEQGRTALRVAIDSGSRRVEAFLREQGAME